jgi:small subunit ribosomal protein S2
MLTNFQTVHKRLQRMKELESMEQNGWEGTATKKEQLMLEREKNKLERTLGGIREMSKVPSAVWIVDTKKEHIAVGEAHKLGIPVIAILDTNCDPDEVTYPIPGNDDAIRSVSLLTRVVADAVADGLIARAGAAEGEAKPAPASGDIGAEEPLAEWELAVLEGKASDAAAAEAPDAPAGEQVNGTTPDQANGTVADQANGTVADQANGTVPEPGDTPAPEPEAAGVSAGSGESREA